jgi:hypothetical protein
MPSGGLKALVIPIFFFNYLPVLFLFSFLFFNIVFSMSQNSISDNTSSVSELSELLASDPGNTPFVFEGSTVSSSALGPTTHGRAVRPGRPSRRKRTQAQLLASVK